MDVVISSSCGLVVVVVVSVVAIIHQNRPSSISSRVQSISCGHTGVHAKSVEMQLSQHQHQDSPLSSPGNVSLTLQSRNMDTSVGRCEDTGCIPYEMSATDT